MPLTALTIKEGLSQGMIYDIRQTHDGFMWFGTKDGLNRYDGYHFTVFRNSPSDSFSLSDNTVTRLFEDSHHRLWVKTRTSLDLYDPRTQRFRHLPLPSPTHHAYRGEITDIEEDQAGNLWISFGHLYKITLPQQTGWQENNSASLSNWLNLQQIPLPVEEVIIDLGRDNRGTLLIAALDHTYRILPGQQQPEEIHPEGQPGSPVRSTVIVSTPENHLFLLGGDGTFRVEGLRAIPAPASGLPESTNRYCYDTQGYIWFSAPISLEIFQAPASSLGQSQFSQQMTALETNVYITSICMDRTGNLWLGTNGYGIRLYNPNTRLFHHHAAGHSIGRLRKDAAGNVYFRQFFGIRKAVPPRYDARTARDLTPGLEIDVLPQADGGLWLLASTDTSVEGTDNYLASLDAAGRKTWSVPIPYPLFPYTLLCQDQQQGVWLNPAAPVVVRFDIQTRQLSTHDLRALFAPKSPTVSMLYADARNTLWIGTNMGLLKGIRKNGQLSFALIQGGEQHPHALPTNGITSFCDDPNQPDQYLWVGTNGGGLVRMDKNTYTCLTFSEKAGLPNAVVYGILPDNRGGLWISTNRGLARFDPISHTFHAYTREDGLQDDEFNTHAFFRTPAGELCFGGVNGFNLFFPEALQTDTLAPQTVIVDLKVNNQSLTMQDSARVLSLAPNFPQTIHLPYTRNYLSFSFATFDFTNVRKNQFRYMLEGADRGWIYAGNQPVANYTALPPGTYTFRVMGCNADGVWSREAATLTVVIHPPLWRTWWAWTLYACILVFSGYKLYQYQIQRIKLANQLQYEQKEASRLAALDELKTRFFANVTHEFRTPLALILEPARRLSRELRDTPHAGYLALIENNGQRLLQLVNQLLDLSKLESGMMQPNLQRGDLTEVISPIYQGFLPLIQRKRIQFTWHYPEVIPNFSFDRDKIEKILHNLLSNAVKFTPEGGKIDLTTLVQHQSLLIQVADTGIGMDQQTLGNLFSRFYQADNSSTRRGEGTGIGLALVRELVELLGGTVTAESEAGAGSTFSVRLPLPEHLPDTSPAISRQPTPKPVVIPPALMHQPGDPETLILVVEDNMDMQDFLHDIISGAGFRVEVASNGAEGIEKAFELVPDFVISDVTMPEKDGFELTRVLKTDLRTSHIPIMLLSARSAQNSKLTGLRMGADEYLPKPFDTEEVLLRIRNLTALRHRMNALTASAAAGVAQPAPAQEEAAQETPALLSEIDQQFLSKLSQLIENELENESIDVETLTSQFGLSRSQLHRKMVALTGQSAMEFVRNFRLDKAYVMLQHANRGVADVAWATGFKDPKHFSTIFRKRFGMPPSEVQRIKGE